MGGKRVRCNIGQAQPLRSSGVERVQEWGSPYTTPNAPVLSRFHYPVRAWPWARVLCAAETILKVLIAEGCQQPGNALILEGQSGLSLSISTHVFISWDTETFTKLQALVSVLPKLELIFPWKCQVMWYVCTFWHVHSTCLLVKHHFIICIYMVQIKFWIPKLLKYVSYKLQKLLFPFCIYELQQQYNKIYGGFAVNLWLADKASFTAGQQKAVLMIGAWKCYAPLLKQRGFCSVKFFFPFLPIASWKRTQLGQKKEIWSSNKNSIVMKFKGEFVQISKTN